MDMPTRPREIIRFGSFELDEEANELREDGRARKLPAQPFRILLLLAGRPGQIVSRQEIRQCLWGDRKYVEVDRGINFCLNQIRTALRDPAETARYIKTIPRSGYSFIAPVTVHLRDQTSPVPASSPLPPIGDILAPSPTALVVSRRTWLPWAMCIAFAGCLVGLAGDAGIASRHADMPVVKNAMVVVDFSNSTGEAVFDDTLEQALTIALRQSPILEVLAEPRKRQTLKLMGRSVDQRITPEIAREICVRSGSNATVHGLISKIGDHYWVSVQATACASGLVLANEQREVAQKDDVLHALGQAASNLRTGLGESLTSAQKFDAPVDATTTSLDALQSYSQGIKVLMAQGDAPSIPFFKNALELDPLFALADASLAARYNNLGQPGQALVYATKAYDLRDRVSERERLVITGRYLRLRGELEKLTQILDMWKLEFPRDGNPRGSLGINYILLGQYSKALPELEDALRLSPDDAMMYDNLATLYIVLDDPTKAKALLEEATARKLDSGGLRLLTYELAFIDKDDAQMRRQVEWATARPGAEDLLLSMQSDTEAYYGRLTAARGFSMRAVASAIRSDYPESAALWQAHAALREAEFGDKSAAISDADRALAFATGRNVTVMAALAFARAGNVAKAEDLVHELETRNGVDTMVTTYHLPVIKAAMALSEGNPRQALVGLESVKPYDFARPSPSGMITMYPSFLRGEAYLALGDGNAALIEYQKVIDHPGLTLNLTLGPLAHLGIARAYFMTGEITQAIKAYGKLAQVWQDADTTALPVARAKRELVHVSMDR